MNKNGKAVLLAAGLGIIAGALGGWLIGIGVAAVFVATGMEVEPATGKDGLPLGWKAESVQPGSALDVALRTEYPTDDQTRVH